VITWRAPEELLRTLVEAEISARDASNARTRLIAAAFLVTRLGKRVGFARRCPIAQSSG
jgi:hypothetical protein